MAICIASLGLFGLTLYNSQKRIREIGIRKVMGAPVPRIFLVLSKSFLINLAISCVLGCVGGYYLSLMLLDSIWDHFLDFTPGIYIYSVLIIIFATTVTISGKIYQAALQNPAHCLRYE